MPRGLFTAAALIAIALVCVATARKMERERRLLRKLHQLEPGRALHLDDLSARERDAAYSLSDAGVLTLQGDRISVKQAALKPFQRKRLRLALSGATGALLLACLVAFLILRR